MHIKRKQKKSSIFCFPPKIENSISYSFLDMSLISAFKKSPPKHRPKVGQEREARLCLISYTPRHKKLYSLTLNSKSLSLSLSTILSIYAQINSLMPSSLSRYLSPFALYAFLSSSLSYHVKLSPLLLYWLPSLHALFLFLVLLFLF